MRAVGRVRPPPDEIDRAALWRGLTRFDGGRPSQANAGGPWDCRRERLAGAVVRDGLRPPTFPIWTLRMLPVVGLRDRPEFGGVVEFSLVTKPRLRRVSPTS